MKQYFLAATFAVAASLACAQPTAGALSVPPSGAQKFIIVSAAGPHGTAWRWRDADGTDVIRESVILRGSAWEQELRVRGRAGQRPEAVVVRGRSPSGDSSETFTIQDGQAAWQSKVDSGRVPDDGRSFYLLAGGTWAAPDLAEHLYRAPGREAPLLPRGKARLQKVVDIDVGSGPSARTITSWAIEGVGLEPALVLLDAEGRYFGWAGTMALLPEAYSGEHLKIQKAQIEAVAAREPAIARRFRQVPPHPVAFTHVKLFDAEALRFLEDQTVVVNAGKIVAVGAAASTPAPAGARIIDGRGHTLSPGLWDAHLHAGSDRSGAMLLSLGVTSGRDPGSDVQRLLLRKGPVARGELLYPTLHSSLLIDGKGPLAAQLGTAVGSREDALEAVRMARREGFIGVKFYGSLDPQWIAGLAAEARKLGLHVHGHVPARMRPREAVAAGYEELTHINFVLMEALPDDVVGISNTVARFQGPGRYGKDVDFDKEPMASFIRELGQKRITVDPTLVVFERLLVAVRGEPNPSYAPFDATLPPATQRGLKGGAATPPAGVSTADYRASWRKLLELTRRLHDAGAPIVAGTDGSGIELVRELELYVEAGLTPAQALATATINPARLVGVDKTTGSIALGKQADLVLVEGDPARSIGALRQTRWVMQGGALMNADELRDLVGFSGRPK